MTDPKVSAKDIPDATALRACDWAGTGMPPYRRLMLLGYPEKVVYAKIHKLVERGDAEYGVSERTAWITDQGRARLAGMAP